MILNTRIHCVGFAVAIWIKIKTILIKTMIQIPDITAKTKESETQYETKNKTWSKLAGELLRVHIEIIVNSDKKFVATVASYCEILKKVLFNKSHLNCLVKMSFIIRVSKFIKRRYVFFRICCLICFFPIVFGVEVYRSIITGRWTTPGLRRLCWLCWRVGHRQRMLGWLSNGWVIVFGFRRGPQGSISIWSNQKWSPEWAWVSRGREL